MYGTIYVVERDGIMNSNIIEFYMKANELKNVIRTGWLEVGINADRIESVAEHIYGTLILAIGLASEKNLEIDMTKTMKMIVVKELEKINLMKEFTPRKYPDANERKLNARKVLLDITKELKVSDELMALFDEYQEGKTKEAKFCLMVSKLESDLQAKIYDLNGNFSIEKAIEDAKYFENSDEIVPKIKNASDSWIEYDRKYYEEDKMFRELSKDIQNINKYKLEGDK